MTTRLVQKNLLKGRREFEITHDAVHVRIRTLFRQERLTVGLSMLEPEPVVNGAELEFHGRAGSGPLLSLWLDEPDAEEFSAFVIALKQRVLEAYGASAALETDAHLPGGNVHAPPPEFDQPDRARPAKDKKPVDAAKLDNAIRMLERYLDIDEIGPLLSALEALRAEPANEARMAQVVRVFNGLGLAQGAVLNYAPYLGILLSEGHSQIIDDLFNDSN